MSKNNRNVNNKRKKKKGENYTETRTFNPPLENSASATLPIENQPQSIIYENIARVVEIDRKINSIEKDIVNIKYEVSSLKEKENRLLNRFGWILIMANILIGVLVALIIFIFVDFVYPFLEETLQNHQGQFWFITTFAALILGAICSLWWKVEKFAIYIKNRDKSNQKME